MFFFLISVYLYIFKYYLFEPFLSEHVLNTGMKATNCCFEQSFVLLGSAIIFPLNTLVKLFLFVCARHVVWLGLLTGKRNSKKKKYQKNIEKLFAARYQMLQGLRKVSFIKRVRNKITEREWLFLIYNDFNKYKRFPVVLKPFTLSLTLLSFYYLP